MSDLYHKIQSVYLRDPATNHRTFLEGQYSTPEIELLAAVDWEWTEKVDGTNVRVMWDGERVTFGGRTDNAQLHAGLVNRLQSRFTAEALGEVFADSPAMLCGEGYGEKIQKGGGNYRKGQNFVLFDVYCGMWLERSNVFGIGASLGCGVVPVVGYGTLAEAVEWVKGTPESTWGDFPAEGIVLRPTVELQTRRGGRVITKLKAKDFPE